MTAVEAVVHSESILEYAIWKHRVDTFPKHRQTAGMSVKEWGSSWRGSARALVSIANGRGYRGPRPMSDDETRQEEGGG